MEVDRLVNHDCRTACCAAVDRLVREGAGVAARLGRVMHEDMGPKVSSVIKLSFCPAGAEVTEEFVLICTGPLLVVTLLIVPLLGLALD